MTELLIYLCDMNAWSNRSIMHINTFGFAVIATVHSFCTKKEDCMSAKCSHGELAECLMVNSIGDSNGEKQCVCIPNGKRAGMCYQHWWLFADYALLCNHTKLRRDPPIHSREFKPGLCVKQVRWLCRSIIPTAIRSLQTVSRIAFAIRNSI